MDNTTSMPEKFRLGHPAIDAQHEVLFAIYDEISHSLGDGDGNFTMNLVFASLNTYIKTHFKFEEVLMEKSAYPGRAHHQEEHRSLENQVVAIASRFHSTHDDGEKHVVAEETRKFLYEWLTEHIAMTDKKLSLAMAEMAKA